MWVRTDWGVDLVPNPEWSGEAPEVQCQRCPDPFSTISWSNVPVPEGDDPEYKWRRKVHEDGTPLLALEKNPNWGGEQPTGDGEESINEELVEQSIDRSNSVYHASGEHVLRREVLENIGGVLSQGTIGLGEDGHFPTVELLLDADGEYPGYIAVNGASASSRYHIRYAELVPAALFVDGGGTSLYTLWSFDKLPATFSEDAGFVKTKRGLGLVAIEFAGTRYEDAMVFLDICAACEAVPEHTIESVIAEILAAGEIARPRTGSYINTDVGASFRLEDWDASRVAVAGIVSRYYWSMETDEGQAVSIKRVWPMVAPGDMRANANRFLDLLFSNRDIENRHILLLMDGIDAMRQLREEAGLAARRKLADALYLFETLALLRTTKQNSPEQWSKFMTALSSDWLVRQQKRPWELYTKTFCSVYPEVSNCG
ncbi:MAG: hypothetical protein OXI90_17480 [Gammaproteobacteria bacterium]|nr:hypothetical protein [Gammaproteobacteria bacterium]